MFEIVNLNSGAVEQGPFDKKADANRILKELAPTMHLGEPVKYEVRKVD